MAWTGRKWTLYTTFKTLFKHGLANFELTEFWLTGYTIMLLNKRDTQVLINYICHFNFGGRKLQPFRYHTCFEGCFPCVPWLKMHLMSCWIPSKIPLLTEFSKNIWGFQTFNVILFKCQNKFNLQVLKNEWGKYINTCQDRPWPVSCSYQKSHFEIVYQWYQPPYMN